MQQTHLQNRAHAIHLDCILVLLCTQGKTGLIMNNLISTWKVTSGFFQKKAFSLSEESSQVCGWMCFPPRLQGHWRQVTTLPPSFETLALSPTPSLLDEAEKHVLNKAGRGGEIKKKRWKRYFGSCCSFLVLCFTTLHDCMRLYLEQMYTEVPCAQPRTLSLALASSLRSIVKAGADGFQCYSKNKDHRWCLGTLCSRFTSSQIYQCGSLLTVSVKSWAYCLYLHLHYYIKLLELALHVHLCLLCQLITSIFMIIPYPLLPLFLTGTLFWPFLKSFCIWRYLFLPLSPLLSDCRKRNRAEGWLYHSVDVR